MSRITVAICAFFGLALVLYWQVQVKRNQQHVVIDSSIERPAYIANNLRTTEFNEQGLIESKVSAKYMEHYASSNTTKFTQPILLLYPENGKAQWRVTAQNASLDQQTNIVNIENDVIIDAIDIEEPLQSLATQKVTFDLNTMIGESQEPVQIKGIGYDIKGVGLFADLNAEQITLLSQVEGTYEPH
ncbi:LPS export ABC transporter periplasmic protein LptC [Shewanella gaetbuli]|uniref:Lipopolysaccharide export system protein LptC n=1 Tax=Shewanella gaetbuli TaxID=220752 RepID=A0A9X2CHP9_9GAMM|nr:LPS export ABC transporter periplasmic protein LptC [Shewanella gaetbuli]MCL1143763.1 LPS export ABC transporter periplasmic protein LptC [Shewanella gaetbuli]